MVGSREGLLRGVSERVMVGKDLSEEFSGEVTQKGISTLGRRAG